MGTYLVSENDNWQYYKCPWCFPTSFCGQLCSHHLCQMTVILNFFEHDFGNVNFPVIVHLPVAAAEDILPVGELRNLPSHLWYML